MYLAEVTEPYMVVFLAQQKGKDRGRTDVTTVIAH